MYSKVQIERPAIISTACGVIGHRGEKCWTVVWYPQWNPKHTTRQGRAKPKGRFNTRGTSGSK